MNEIKERPVKWVYEIVRKETGEIVTVISRKFISEIFGSLRNYYYFNCVGYFGYDNAYHPY